MFTVEIPIPDKKQPPVLKFPDRCVHCGKPKHIVMPMKLDMGVQKRGQGVLMDFPVPLCAECERKEKRVVNLTLLPFTVAGFLICGLVFIPVWLITPDGTTPQSESLRRYIAQLRAWLESEGCTLIDLTNDPEPDQSMYNKPGDDHMRRAAKEKMTEIYARKLGPLLHR